MVWNSDLRPRNVVFRAVHKRPQSLAPAGKFAGENAVLQHRKAGLPIAADQQAGKGALDAGDPAQRLGVARRQAVPDAPDVFPTFEPNAVEERLLQIVGVIAGPAVADVDHVSWLEPFVFA